MSTKNQNPNASAGIPTGALLYGEDGAYSVLHYTNTGRTRYTFADEYLAQRFAVSVGSTVNT